MSTRGAVAWKVRGGARGVYNHSDSYPSGLGLEVLEQAQRLGVKGLISQLKKWGDWREMMNGGVCPYCGKSAGQPHSISAVMNGFAPWTREEFIAMRKDQAQGRPDLQKAYEHEIATLDQVEANRNKTGYPDPEAKSHMHGDGDRDQFNPFEDGLYMEWVYLLDSDRRVIEVWAGVRETYFEKMKQGGLPFEVSGVLDKHGYTHMKVGVIDMTATGEDMVRLEARASTMIEG